MSFSSMSLLGVRLVKGWSETLLMTSTFPWPARAPYIPSYPPPYPLWPWQTQDVAGAPCPIRPWRISIAARIHLAYGQERWLPKCSPTEQADRSKYSPMSPAKTPKTNWGCQNLQEVKNQKVKILLRQEQKIWRADARLKLWTSDAELTSADLNAVWF